MIFAVTVRAKGLNMEEVISFEDLGLDEASLAAVAAKGFENPSPIQVLAIPRLLTGDANVIAKARTGTGKTAAFGIPLAQTIREDSGYVRALVLTPTRELALQVGKEIESLSTGKFPRIATVYGGQSMGEQLRKLRSGVEIVVGTPGRVQDHLERNSLQIDKIDYFILDEADEMLDMGFIDDIEQIFAQANPNSRVLLFSATMPPAILKIASKFMGEYEIVEEEERPEEPVLTEQYYWIVKENEKINALVRLIDIAPDFYGLIFTQTKSDADFVAKELDERGYEAAALHGDIAQAQREKILARFRKRKTRILVATDVAARGIDIGGLSHVVNYAMPFDGPTYIHRIGRTGRAGAKGLAYTLVRPEERRKTGYLRNVSGGNLKEGKVPSVEEVLKVKRERLFSDMLKTLGLAEEKSTGIENIQEQIDSAENNQDLNIDENENQSEIREAEILTPPKKVVKSASKQFTSFAEQICQDQDPVAVLAAVLEENFGRALNPDRYGNVSSFSANQQNNSSRQIRLYVGLGRRDGMGRPEIARFFADLLHIPGRLVDRIDVATNFSLVSLPPDAAMRALDMSKKNRNVPHIHIDAKSGDNFGDRFGNSAKRSRQRFSGRDFERGGRERPIKGDRNFGKRRAAPKEMMPMQHRTSNASLYKKQDS